MTSGGRIATHLDFYKAKAEKLQSEGWDVEIQFVEGTGDVYINYGTEIGKWG